MDRKIEIKRLLIFLALAFGLAWGFFAIFLIGGFRFDEANQNSISIGLGMLAPFIANILTRKITNEGYAMTGRDSLMLGISFKNRRWLIYIIAILLPLFYTECANLIKIAVSGAFDAEYYKEYGITKAIVLIYPISAIIMAMVASFGGLGEEAGWRGYMMPKLMNLMGYKKAILVGGVIWGVWHAPLTCVGHNFGTDYPGFPYVGILMMCIMCTLVGVIFTYVTLKTGSIWPAAIMHAVNNASPSMLNFFINQDIYSEKISNPIVDQVLYLIPIFIIAGVLFVLTCKSTKSKESVVRL